jgi:hypothetical protein
LIIINHHSVIKIAIITNNINNNWHHSLSLPMSGLHPNLSSHLCQHWPACPAQDFVRTKAKQP